MTANEKKRFFTLGKMAVHTQWIKDGLHSRPTWTKTDYEDFYERDVKLLLGYVDLLLQEREAREANLAFEFLEETIFGVKHGKE